MLRWGQTKTAEAQNYMNKAVSYVHDLIKRHDIKCDYEHNGMVRVAYSKSQERRLEKSLNLLEKLGVRHRYQYRDKTQMQESLHSPRLRAGIFEANSGILNPYKHVRALKALALAKWVFVYEKTPVSQITRVKNNTGKALEITTPKGKVQCEKLVIAANAWSGTIRGLPKLGKTQTPVLTGQIVTAPLSDQQWQDIGWNERLSLEDNRQLLHYARRTACGRFTMGGGNIAYPSKHNFGTETMPKIWSNLQKHIEWLFPNLKGIAIDYQWGGPVSVNMDMTPEIGFIGDERIIYTNGCIGHGVSLSQLNGRTIADLVLEKQTELTDFWIINRKAIPLPPQPLVPIVIRTIKSVLQVWDKIDERDLNKSS